MIGTSLTGVIWVYFNTYLGNTLVIISVDPKFHFKNCREQSKVMLNWLPNGGINYVGHPQLLMWRFQQGKAVCQRTEKYTSGCL